MKADVFNRQEWALQPAVRGQRRTTNPWGLAPRMVDLLNTMVSADNDSDKSLSRALGVSTRTVECQLQTVRARMGGVSRTQAVLLWDRYLRGLHPEDQNWT